ncbi:MAG: Druantia anti-phage system protein DruA, partial [PVC group bacterium]
LSIMSELVIIQGRHLTSRDIDRIRQLLIENPSWNRTRLSRELCQLWNWRNGAGQLKDMACRNLLLKLERPGHINLPPRRGSSPNAFRNKALQYVLHSTAPIRVPLKTLVPIRIEVIKDPADKTLSNCFFSLYHYLGYGGTVGQNMRYFVFDRDRTPLACLLFGSAAWKTKPRDSFIGWDIATRKRNLPFITNNMRFLILPWVRVPHLASHILARIARRISGDWVDKYGRPIYLLETFVERDRFQGTSYRAANWIRVGQTRGRTRNDRDNSIRVPIKDVYLYPLCRNFRQKLNCELYT